ncbi:TIGR02281 family clan AA aspartic protease [Halieaceae bacterium IMCC8485]|jgi:aspartyl protease family protein|uniref:TIGR02281 family clan AA aspartic protease n=1 Tax=Candidatus Seongchinamella marina TaxID=2518990 RepID=A0ABT3SS70_9GAMM|nr:TIGR02281 family clan AA aspartic protease [Candidatus Seongchinamella marina]MCX2972828.1 TIGR02281 family clan AA aspartic protease [Candidatus Seongchinamella marina]
MNSQDSIKEQKRMGLGMMILAWMVFLGLGILFFGDVLEKQFNPNQRLDTQYSKAGMREVVLQRNKFGHYVTSGTINGQPVTFMLDTGATGVAIPEAIARKLDIPRGRPYRTQTANGISTSYAASLDSVAVGEIELRDVQAGIAPGLAMNQILLGMTFLKHIEFTQRGDTLILRQYL